jgi:hypothetical protein
MRAEFGEHVMRSNHAHGHIRETFLDAIHVFAKWCCSDDWPSSPLPTVTREIRYEPHEISLAAACGLVWHCTDILPRFFVEMLTENCGLRSGRRTYAAAAHAILAELKREGLAVNRHVGQSGRVRASGGCPAMAGRGSVAV